MPSRSRAEVRLRAVHWSPLACGALWLALGCEADREVSTVALELRAPPGCELGAASGFELRALGDFRARREAFDFEGDRATFERFPIGTRELAIEGRFAADRRASGRTSIEGAAAGEPVPVVLLPEPQSCPLPEGFLPGEGAAVAALRGGGLLVAGGTDVEGRARTSAVVLRGGRTLYEQLPEDMLLRRRDASATLTGDFVVVAGGARETRGNAEENYEVYDVERGRFARERSDQLSQGPRMEHGAALLPDGSVLLAGGRSEPGGPPLASAELIRLEPPAPDPPSALHRARIAPEVLVLDSGAVLIAGGRDAQGVLVTTLERFEAAARRFVTLALELPAFESAVAVALPGARLAWIGCDTRSRSACGLSLVLLRGDEPIVIDVPLRWDEHAPRGLVELRAVALEDGRLLLTGREPDGAMTSRAIAIDLGEPSLETIPATRAPSALVRLEDGAIAELDRFGTSLRRIGSVSIYDSPEGDLMDEAHPHVVVDAPDRWERSSDGLRALVSGSRLDVPRLRLGSFRAELELDGGALVRLRAAGAPVLTIQLGGDRPAANGCESLPAGRVVVERRGTAIRVSAGPRVCALRWATAELASLAFEVEADTRVRSLTITRL